MLKGRESLLRLIGKRRRLLSSSRRLLLSSNSITSTINSSVDAHRNEVEGKGEPQLKPRPGLSSDGNEIKKRGRVEDEAEKEVEEEKSLLVICPVCGKRVSGEEYTINSHLDTCLTTGAKRKLTQYTLLQFNFAKDKFSLSDEVVANPDTILDDSVDEFPVDLCHPQTRSDTSENDKTSADEVSTSDISFNTKERSNSGSPRTLDTDLPSVTHVNEEVSSQKILTSNEMDLHLSASVYRFVQRPNLLQ